LVPVALVAADRWRAVASAAATAGLLAVAAAAAFGVVAWTAFPHQLAAQMNENIPAVGVADAAARWGYVQTIYGIGRLLHADARSAWLGQIAATSVLALIVWVVWRSPARYPLRAATLSASALIATPYAFAYDMAALAVPAAFLAKDQIECGFLRGERAIMTAAFLALLAALAIFGDRPNSTTFGAIPAGPIAVTLLLGLILRRALAMPPAAP
jgi:hypothetical protein